MVEAEAPFNPIFSETVLHNDGPIVSKGFSISRRSPPPPAAPPPEPPSLPIGSALISRSTDCKHVSFLDDLHDLPVACPFAHALLSWQLERCTAASTRSPLAADGKDHMYRMTFVCRALKSVTTGRSTTRSACHKGSQFLSDMAFSPVACPLGAALTGSTRQRPEYPQRPLPSCH